MEANKFPVFVKSAAYSQHSPGLVNIVLSDDTKCAIYTEDNSPRCIVHEMLDEWIANGNEIENLK